MDRETLEQLYKEVMPLVENFMRSLGGGRAEACKVLELAKLAHLSVENETRLRLEKYWAKQEKNLILNICKYELLKLDSEAIEYTFIENVYKTQMQSATPGHLIAFISKKKNKKRKEKVTKSFQHFLSNITFDLPSIVGHDESYYFIPFKFFIESSYENYLLKESSELRDSLIEMLSEKILYGQEKNEDLKYIFHGVILDILEKAQKETLKPRRSSLENYVKGACFNQRFNHFRQETNLRKGKEAFKNEILRQEDKNEIVFFENETPKETSLKITNFINKLPEQQMQLVRLKAQSVDNDEIIRRLDYENKNSQKTQWYKVRQKFKLFFKENPEVYEYLSAMTTLLGVEKEDGKRR